jgi:hypothetical protein
MAGAGDDDLGWRVGSIGSWVGVKVERGERQEEELGKKKEGGKGSGGSARPFF